LTGFFAALPARFTIRFFTMTVSASRRSKDHLSVKRYASTDLDLHDSIPADRRPLAGVIVQLI
jgi:hypothetical protein